MNRDEAIRKECLTVTSLSMITAVLQVPRHQVLPGCVLALTRTVVVGGLTQFGGSGDKSKMSSLDICWLDILYFGESKFIPKYRKMIHTSKVC